MKIQGIGATLIGTEGHRADMVLDNDRHVYGVIEGDVPGDCPRLGQRLLVPMTLVWVMEGQVAGARYLLAHKGRSTVFLVNQGRLHLLADSHKEGVIDGFLGLNQSLLVINDGISALVSTGSLEGQTPQRIVDLANGRHALRLVRETLTAVSVGISAS